MAVSQVCKEGEHKKPWIAWMTSWARCQSSSWFLLRAKAALGAFGGQELWALEKELQPCPCAAKLTVTAGFCAGMTGGSCAPLVHPAASSSSQLPPGLKPQVRMAQSTWDRAGTPAQVSWVPSQICQLLEGEDSGQDFPTAPHFPWHCSSEGNQTPITELSSRRNCGWEKPRTAEPGFSSPASWVEARTLKKQKEPSLNLPQVCSKQETFAASDFTYKSALRKTATVIEGIKNWYN